MSPLKVTVNPTINGINIDLLKDEVQKFKNLVESKVITYSENDFSMYKADLDEVKSLSMSKFGFIKMIYYNAFGIDIGYLESENIKQAIFNGPIDNYFQKKTEKEISSLTNKTSIDINKMLVKGIYGGRQFRGNDNLDRVQFL